MRSRSILVVFTLALAALIGLQLILGQAANAIAPVSVSIKPETLNLDLADERPWITVYVEPLEGFEIGDINASTVRLEGLAPEWGFAQGVRLMLKFRAEDVATIIWLKIYHLTSLPEDKMLVELTVTGQMNDGTDFEGSDEIRVKASPP